MLRPCGVNVLVAPPALKVSCEGPYRFHPKGDQMNNVESYPVTVDIIPKAAVLLCDQDSDALKQYFLHVLILYPSRQGQFLSFKTVSSGARDFSLSFFFFFFFLSFEGRTSSIWGFPG